MVIVLLSSYVLFWFSIPNSLFRRLELEFENLSYLGSCELRLRSSEIIYELFDLSSPPSNSSFSPCAA